MVFYCFERKSIGHVIYVLDRGCGLWLHGLGSRVYITVGVCASYDEFMMNFERVLFPHFDGDWFSLKI